MFRKTKTNLDKLFGAAEKQGNEQPVDKEFRLRFNLLRGAREAVEELGDEVGGDGGDRRRAGEEPQHGGSLRFLAHALDRFELEERVQVGLGVLREAGRDTQFSFGAEKVRRPSFPCLKKFKAVNGPAQQWMHKR